MSDRRFPRAARLLSAADFKPVFERSRRSADRYFTVLATARGHGRARLGLAISKKQVRRAVDRSRLKRLVREAFRLHQARLAGLDLVVMARHASVEADNLRLTASLLHHFDVLAAPPGGPRQAP